jgi:hypothetical protein
MGRASYQLLSTFSQFRPDGLGPGLCNFVHVSPALLDTLIYPSAQKKSGSRKSISRKLHGPTPIALESWAHTPLLLDRPHAPCNAVGWVCNNQRMGRVSRSGFRRKVQQHAVGQEVHNPRNIGRTRSTQKG